jgi:hypothetical protein
VIHLLAVAIVTIFFFYILIVSILFIKEFCAELFIVLLATCTVTAVIWAFIEVFK